MNLKRKIKIWCLISILLFFILSVKTFASSLSISTSQSSVSAGASFTATITGNDAIGQVNISVSNGTASSSSIWVDGSESITVTAGSSGTVTITATGSDMSDASGNDLKTNPTNSASVTIVSSSSSTDSSSSTTTTTTSSSAPTLSVLGITPYDFTGFKSGTTSYSVTVPNDCTSVSIYAKTNSSGATITGTGTVTLKEGTNKYTVTVSNSNGSTSYTLSIIRQSEESEIIANSSDEETDEDNSNGIGLDSLTITGYELNEEFNINTYEYTVTLSEEITEELLEEIKSKIFWTANSEDVNVEYEIEVLEDGTTGTITLVVKDEEREYSRYVITFMNSTEEEEEKTIAVAGTTSSNNSDGGTTGLDSTTQKVIALIGCIILTVGLGIYFAISSYIKSRHLQEYENEGESGDIANIVESIMKEKEEKGEINTSETIEQPEEKIPVMQEANATDSKDEESLEPSNAADLLKDSSEKLADLGGYRKLRKGFSGGRH